MRKKTNAETMLKKIIEINNIITESICKITHTNIVKGMNLPRKMPNKPHINI